MNSLLNRLTLFALIHSLGLHFALAQVSQSQSTGAAASGDRNNSAAANRINEAQLAGLPLNGRSYNQLATLQAGVSDSAATSASRGVGGGNLSMSGSRPSSNNFLLDGTNLMDAVNNGPSSAAGVQLGSDAVMQVQVFSNNYSAEYGRTSGGVLNSITRSGSNDFHATLFEYFRNSKLDSRNFFDPGSPPPFKRNQFGFTLTGALHKDRTFFMGSFESMRDRLSRTDVTFFPDEKARLGVIENPNGSSTVVPVADSVQPYLRLFPIPNGTRLGRGIASHYGSQFLPTNEYFLSLRIDHKLSSRDSVFLRYTFDDARSIGASDSYLFQLDDKTRQQFATLTGSHIFSLSLLNTYRIGFARPTDLAGTASSLDVPAQLYFSPEATQLGQLLVPGLTSFGPSSSYPLDHVMNSFQFAGDFILQHGRHALKFGAEANRSQLNVGSEWFKAAAWSFNSLESFLQGGPSGTQLTVAIRGSNNTRALRQTLAGAYLQDEVRLSPAWQLSAGLRFEYATLVSDNYRKFSFMPDFVRDAQVQVGRYISDNPSGIFSPRLGITRSPGNRRNTVISAGAGIYYDQILAYVLSQRKSSSPFHNIAVNQNFNSSNSFPNAIAAAAGIPSALQIFDFTNTVLPTVYRYHFSVQQLMPLGWRLQMTYVGARGNHLFRRFEANQFPLPDIQTDGSYFFPSECPKSGSTVPAAAGCRAYAGPINPAHAAISLIPTDGQSFYNSLQVSASRAVANLSLQLSYAYSKSVDDNSTGVVGNVGQYALARTLDRGLSDFDIRQRLTLNYFYTLPLGAGQRWLRGGIASKVIGGWRIGGILSARSGAPYTPTVRLRYAGYLFEAQRPNVGPGGSTNPVAGNSTGCGLIPSGQALRVPELAFDPCAFGAPAPGRLGDLGRNTIIAPAVLNMDLSFTREFKVDSKRKIQFRAELFNLANHTNFNKPAGSSLTIFSGSPQNRASNAGRITTTATTSRQLQFALRLAL